MFDSYSSDQTSTLFDDEMIDEGRDADESELADEVWDYYHHLRDDRHFTHNEAIECVSNDLKVTNPERYIS